MMITGATEQTNLTKQSSAVSPSPGYELISVAVKWAAMQSEWRRSYSFSGGNRPGDAGGRALNSKVWMG
jgi:hypothetical protein